jgi:uncharacterized membrane protein YhaH (DUF805 family)
MQTRGRFAPNQRSSLSTSARRRRDSHQSIALLSKRLRRCYRSATIVMLFIFLLMRLMPRTFRRAVRFLLLMWIVLVIIVMLHPSA